MVVAGHHFNVQVLRRFLGNLQLTANASQFGLEALGLFSIYVSPGVVAC